MYRNIHEELYAFTDLLHGEKSKNANYHIQQSCRQQDAILQLEEVSENKLQGQMSENIHSKASVGEYIIKEIPLSAGVTKYE